jgi:hypothetical protein
MDPAVDFQSHGAVQNQSAGLRDGTPQRRQAFTIAVLSAGNGSPFSSYSAAIISIQTRPRVRPELLLASASARNTREWQGLPPPGHPAGSDTKLPCRRQDSSQTQSTRTPRLLWETARLDQPLCAKAGELQAGNASETELGEIWSSSGWQLRLWTTSRFQANHRVRFRSNVPGAM